MKKRSKAISILLWLLAFISMVLLILGISLVRYFSQKGFYGNSLNSLYKTFCANVTDNHVTKALYEAKMQGFPRDWYNSLDELGIDFRIDYTNANGNTHIKYQTPGFTMDASARSHDVSELYSCYYYIDDYWNCLTVEPIVYFSGIPQDSIIKGQHTEIYVINSNFIPQDISYYSVYFNIMSPIEAKDTPMEDSFNNLYNMAFLVSFFIQYGVIFILLFLTLFLVCISLISKDIKIIFKDDKPVLAIWHKIPTIPFILLFALISYLWSVTFNYIAKVQFDLFNHILLFSVMAAILALCLMGLVTGIVIRLKSKTFFVWTRWIVNSIGKAKKSVILVVFIVMVAFTGALIAALTLANRYLHHYVWLVLLGFMAAFTIIIVSYAGQIDRIFKGIRGIENGDIEQSVDTSGMIHYLSSHADAVNNINSVVSNAVEDKLRSEKMRTELITNVSHDIKTPLTSVINYADLITKEECNNPRIYDYCQVLSRQSIKLKKLIEDLIEASKASTGNITMHVEPMDVSVILSQALGEFDDRLLQSGLEVVINNHFNGKVKAYADTRYLWRVFDNLLTNICKYSLNNTRVYIDLFELENNTVSVTFKNISKTKLNMSSNELLERFARGDSSRNTEGSGLGLPIAQSLITLMNGSLNLTIDGDLFRAEVLLAKYVEPEVVSVEEKDAALDQEKGNGSSRKTKKKHSVRKAEITDLNKG
ncbi:MAG: sensor histidine kinase [Clostridia bacterium]|nr:sensor histidine kinase [Clostridia bacterium]